MTKKGGLWELNIKPSEVLDPELEQKVHEPSGPLFDAHSVAGRPAKKIAGPAPAVTRGTHSTRAASAQHASPNGRQHSASRAEVGRNIPTGIGTNPILHHATA